MLEVQDDEPLTSQPTIWTAGGRNQIVVCPSRSPEPRRFSDDDLLGLQCHIPLCHGPTLLLRQSVSSMLLLAGQLEGRSGASRTQ